VVTTYRRGVVAERGEGQLTQVVLLRGHIGLGQEAGLFQVAVGYVAPRGCRS
jgi:hypothetical protein